MRELLILGYALALVVITAGSPTDRGECCLEKTVGDVTYSFVEKDDTAAYGCLSECVYRKKGEMGPKFCFAKGELEVQCESSGRPDMSYNDERICGEDLYSFLSANNNSSITIKCCKSGAQTTCAGMSCLTMCGENITCMIPILNIEDSKQCEKTEFFAPTNVESCKKYANRILKNKPSPMCPGIPTPGFRNPECACCKYHFYGNFYSVCKYQCRCFGICSYFEFHFKSLPSILTNWCQGCPLEPTTTKALPSSSTNSMDTTDLALSSTPPTTDATNETDARQAGSVDCAMCNDAAYAAANDEACKCDCTCKYITGCSGFLANQQWRFCWTDYAFCCECPGTKDYINVCPEICSENPKNGAPILQSTGKVQDSELESVCKYTTK